jgi:hypothetical protein
MTTPTTQSSRAGSRPWRLAGLAAAVGVLAAVVDAVLPRAHFVDSLAIVVMVALCVLATGQVIRLLRGTIPHTAIDYAPTNYFISRDGFQAFAPSGIIAMDGLIAAFAALLATGGDGVLAGAAMLGGGVVFIVFTLVGMCVGSFRRPRLLLPATMRPGRPT